MVNDWNAEAVSMANYVYEHMFEAHRGAMPWKQDGITVVFGNDGYSSDKRARNAVKMLRKFLDSRETPVLGFGVDSEAGHSWAMSVKTADDEVLNDGEVLNSLIWMFFNGHSTWTRLPSGSLRLHGKRLQSTEQGRRHRLTEPVDLITSPPGSAGDYRHGSLGWSGG